MMRERNIIDVGAGLERLSAMLTVFGTYASYHKCENSESIVSEDTMNSAFEMMADYADMLAEQLGSIRSEKSDDL